MLGFRQFNVRGLDAASGEWTLVTMAWNLKRLFNLISAAARTAAAACLKTSVMSPKRRISAAGRPIHSKNSALLGILASFSLPVFATCDFGTLAPGLTPTGCYTAAHK